MTITASPLRYPGGKQILSDSLAQILKLNNFEGQTYLEPYAGGAGAALSLLYSEHVSSIRLNDADPAIYSFWHSVLTRTGEFIALLRRVPLDIEEWKRQRQIYQRPLEHSELELGFATFYLNRCNRSGIIANAGVIGGLAQGGKWKMDVRFNRQELERRILKLSLYSERIAVYNLDALDFLEAFANPADYRDESFVYLDPPYFDKGSQLYLSYYSDKDHSILSSYLRSTAAFPWLLTYDDTDFIRCLYQDLQVVPLSLRYSAGPSKAGKEVLISKATMILPKCLSAH